MSFLRVQRMKCIHEYPVDLSHDLVHAHISLRFLAGLIRIYALHMDANYTHCQSVRRVEHAIRFKIDGRVILCVCINIHCLRTTRVPCLTVCTTICFRLFFFFVFRLKMNSIASCYSPHCDVEPMDHIDTTYVYIPFIYVFVEIMLACTHETHS